jgi:hypothetical protein
MHGAGADRDALAALDQGLLVEKRGWICRYRCQHGGSRLSGSGNFTTALAVYEQAVAFG